MSILDPFASFMALPLVRSWAYTNGMGQLFRVEVRRDPLTGTTLKGTFPVGARKYPLDGPGDQD